MAVLHFARNHFEVIVYDIDKLLREYKRLIKNQRLILLELEEIGNIQENEIIRCDHEDAFVALDFNSFFIQGWQNCEKSYLLFLWELDVLTHDSQ